jgi:hypothetical protein
MLLAFGVKVSVSEVGPSVNEQSQVAMLALPILECWYPKYFEGVHLLPAFPGVLVSSIFVELKK